MIVQHGTVDHHFGLVIFWTTHLTGKQKEKLMSYLEFMCGLKLIVRQITSTLKSSHGIAARSVPKIGSPWARLITVMFCNGLWRWVSLYSCHTRGRIEHSSLCISRQQLLLLASVYWSLNFHVVVDCLE